MCLGKWFDDSLTDRNNISSTEKQTEEWLRKIEKSGLPGKFKAWHYQHGLLPRLMWLLTVYEVPMTSVERVERKINKYLRRWLGIPPSFTSVGLYIRSGQLQLPLSSVVEEFKGSGASVPGSMDQVGLTQEEDHLGRSVEIGAFPHLILVKIGV
ncbi:hypothetical protein ROHU_009463 [Labeo rohita]|uniref:Uncharacterized protein n=1 Tax=Labeo rohita TaxID=84645 RepID=A0A498LD63_LABRO|nr:hypothetical protein ROHU_012872 [Labeo rohita]RXN13756.1 hypothetical protein ROHU_009463 [Labeo rohita]